jgi:hypothetical protein
MKEMAKPEVQQKYVDGPVALVALRAPGLPRLGSSLAQWFVFSLLISIFAAYVATRTLHAGDHYLKVFRITGTVAFLGYAAGSAPAAIWWGKPWPSAIKEMFDGLLYALVTAGAFGWLWPR